MKFQLTILRLLAVFALGMCGVILADTLFSGAFCGLDSGCATVTSSAYGRPLGVPLPVVGLVGFGLVLGLSLVPERRAFALVAPLALLAGLTGVVLILLQFLVLWQTCHLCLLVDGAAIGLAGVVLAGKLYGGRVSWARRLAWLGAAVMAVALPCLLAWLNSVFPAPDRVMSYWVKGKITIVAVTDFDCPRCREAEQTLQTFLKDRGEKAHVVRVVAPVPRLAQSRAAARAYLAARNQGKEDAMASALSSAPRRQPEECRELARSIGLDLARYDKVVSDPATDAELEANFAWAKAHTRGVPTIWVQQQQIFGAPSVASLEAAWRRVLASQLPHTRTNSNPG
jgi:predicted DsbA family dithiol-disulfide isomerase/uncharacterized membrane protein